MDGLIITVGIVAYVIISVLPAGLAKWRGRNPFGWFLFSLVITPIITSAALLFDGLNDPSAGKEIRVKCRECGSLNMEDATYCSSCGVEL